MTEKGPRCTYTTVGVPYIFFYKKKGNGALYLTEMTSALFLCGGAWAARLGLSFTCSYFLLSGVYISIDLLTCLWCQFASP